jgi:hypothetical protein
MCGPLSVLYMTKVSFAMPSFVDEVQQLAHVLVVVDHGVVIRGLPAPRLTDAGGLGVGDPMHVGGIDPAEEGLARRVLLLDPVLGGAHELVVADFHPLLGERARVLDPLLAHPTPSRLLGRIVLVLRPAVEHSPGPKPLAELGKSFWGG